MRTARRIPLRFGRLRPLFAVLGATRAAHIDIADDTVDVRMSYAFHASIPRPAIRAATIEPRAITWSIGVHGWRGRWLVNGSADGIVWLTIDPPARGRVLGVPVTLRTLGVSVDDPAALIAALGLDPA